MKKMSVKLIGTMVAGGVLLTMASAAFASSDGTLPQAPSKDRPAMEGKMHRGQDLSTKLAALVSEGKLTQAQADAITAALPKPEAGVKPTVKPDEAINQLVSAGTLTADQAKQITDKLFQHRPGKGFGLEQKLTQLVSQGALTQAQADALTAALPKPEAGQKPAVTPKDAIAQLVSAGTITQAQADQVLEGMPQPPAAPAVTQ